MSDRVAERNGPCILVFSSLFPTPAQPGAGVFIRERMFRVARHLPLVVVSPQPWFPGQGLIRLFRPHFRQPAPRFEMQQGIAVHRPRFLSVPGLFKWADGWLMALGARRTVRRLAARGEADLIDAHFLYPDGYAATRLGKRLGLPVTITLRGTEERMARDPALRPRLIRAVREATRLIAVAGSLKAIAEDLGAPSDRTVVIGNGVDTERFRPLDRQAARVQLGMPRRAPVLVSVGTLVERKGFHRVIELLPALREDFPDLAYLVVGGPGVEGDWTRYLRERVEALDLQANVRFLGEQPPDALPPILAAADVFVLATRNEGWANVFLEAMACGLPVITTDVGGNRDVVSDPHLGRIVPFGDLDALRTALAESLEADWDRQFIRAHAEANAWNHRIDVLVGVFRAAATGQTSVAATRNRRGEEAA